MIITRLLHEISCYQLVTNNIYIYISATRAPHEGLFDLEYKSPLKLIYNF